MKRQSLTLYSVVIAVHLFFFFYNFKSDYVKPLPKNSITVRTHLPPKPKPVALKPPLPKKKPKPVTLSKKKKALKTLAKSLEKTKVKKEPKKPVALLTLPKEIKKLHIDQTLVSKAEEASYLGTLVGCLQEELQLPEDGNVRLQVTVLQSGRVEKVDVVYAKSDQNRRYLEQALLSLQLPPFSGELKAKRKHTFTFNFCHAK